MKPVLVVGALMLAGCGEFEKPVKYCAEEDRKTLQDVYLRCVDHIGGETALQSLEDVDLDDAIGQCGLEARRIVCRRPGWRTWSPTSAMWVDHPTPERKQRQ